MESDDGIESLPDSVLYDVFYEAGTMLGGMYVARMRAARDPDARKRWQRALIGLDLERSSIRADDREGQIEAKRRWDSERMALMNPAPGPGRPVKVMLSIRPEYVERILSGEKTYEFRRRIFKREDVDTLVVYATSPQRRVVAEARIAGIMESTPEDIWRRTSDRGGISRDRFMDYFAGRDTAYAIELRDVRRLERPMLLSDYAPGVRSAPQSFVYID